MCEIAVETCEVRRVIEVSCGHTHTYMLQDAFEDDAAHEDFLVGPAVIPNPVLDDEVLGVDLYAASPVHARRGRCVWEDSLARVTVRDVLRCPAKGGDARGVARFKMQSLGPLAGTMRCFLA